MNRTARRAASAVAALTGLLGGLLVATPAASAATPCESDCITGLASTPYADGLRLDVTTNAPTLVTADIYFGATLVKSFKPAADADPSTSRTWEMKNGLGQGLWYRYVVKATDVNGHTRTEEGQLRTGRRTLTVTFDKVHMTDDSDSLSAGDITDIGSQAATSTKGTNLGGAQWSSGGTYSVPSLVRNHVVAGAKNGAGVKFVVQDDDDDAWDFGIWGSCAKGKLCTPSFSTGSNAQADWAHATGSLALDGRTGTHTGTFSLATSGSAPLRYSVTGVWSETVRNLASAPRSLTTTPYNSWVKLGWAAPASSGGTSILGYRVTSSLGGSWNLPASARSFNAVGLTNDVPVTFSVVAVNSEGDSPAATITGKAIAVPSTISTVNATGGNAVVNAQWSPAVGQGTTSYRVYLNNVLKATVTTTSASIASPNGVAVTVKVVPFNALGDGPATSYNGTATPYAPSSISGWNTNAMSGAYGTSWSTTVTVTSGGLSGRPVVLQRRLQGGSAWADYKTTGTTMAGTVPVTIPFGTGIWEWRVYAPAWKTWNATSTAIKTMSRTSVISGWSTTTSTFATGWTVLDGITVTPGANRTVKLIGSKAGSGTWSILGSWTADSNGNLTVPVKVQSGTWSYALVVVERYDLGAGTSSAARIITGS